MKPGRNDPCWCGSGKKFKRCHMSQESMPRPTVHELSAPLEKAFTRKTCWHRGVDGSPCGKIVNAHTVPRSMSLKRIAENGHVVGVRRHLPGRGAKAPLEIDTIGITKASTMNGFCRDHDSRVFAPLEAISFAGDQQQLWLLQYRSICRELYAKEGTQQALPPTLELARRGLPPLQQSLMQALTGAFIDGTNSGLEVLRRTKALFDTDFVTSDWSAIHGVVVWFESVPPLMCSSLIAPDYDFAGKRLPDSSGTELEDDLVSFDILGAGEQGAAVLTWRTESALPGQALAVSLLALPLEEMPDAVVRLAFEGTENWFARPSWWSGQSKAARADLEERILCGSPMKAHRPQCMSVRTATYGMPTISRIQYVNWAG